MKNSNQITPPNPNIEPASEDKTIRVDVQEFDGASHEPEAYLDWEQGMERNFEFKSTHPDYQYKVAKVKLVKLAATWLVAYRGKGSEKGDLK